MAEASQPRPGRLEGLDLARGLAVFGMVLVNFKFVLGLEGMEASWAGLVTGVFDGRAAATFVTLAGMGVALLTRRARDTGDPGQLRLCRIMLLKRAIFLLALGVLDSQLWVGDILHFYGVYLAVAALLFDAPSRSLLSLSGLSIAAFAAMFLWLDYEAGWDWEQMAYQGQWLGRGLFRHLFFNGFHPVFPWIAFLLVGLWLGRKDLAAPRQQRVLMLCGAGMTLAAEAISPLVSAWAGSDGGEEAEWCALLFGTGSMPPGPLYLISGGGSALAVIGACLWIDRRFPGSRCIEPIAATGRMALTLYAAHAAALGPLAEWGAGEGIGFAAAAAAGFYAAAVIFAVFWMRRAGHGPLEGLMRRLTESGR